VIENLGRAGFGKSKDTKILLEKPFGTGLGSARKMIEDTSRYFAEDQVYRIDHYLAKEMAQNLLVFRNGNSLFKRTWNKGFIEKIEIVVSEKIGILGRSFYDNTGALRDFVQSHMLQLAALTLMELPENLSWEDVPRKRLSALKALEIPSPETAVRGQYDGYKSEVGKQDTFTETFVSLNLQSASAQWQGVPIILTTGKSLDTRCTEIRIHYRQEDAGEANQLKLQIQPKEGIEFDLWSKRPGLGRELERVQLRFDFNARAEKLPDAYERVLLDAVHSDHSLFASSEEILTAWKLLEPIQKLWGRSGEGLIIYNQGSSPDTVK
jgi:glucose-6-phosphate 1-dehydrogenase